MALAFQGAAGAQASSVALPAHAVGDIIVIYSTGLTTGSTPTAPSAGGTVPTWTAIGTDSSSKAILRYAVATATNHTSGTWTNGFVTIAIVLRGQALSPIGGTAFSFSNSGTTAVPAPSITLSNSTGSSQILHVMVANLAFGTFTWSAAPAGYTSRLSVNTPSSGQPGYRVLTKDSTTSDGSVSNTISTTYYESYGMSLEIKAGSEGAFFSMF